MCEKWWGHGREQGSQVEHLQVEDHQAHRNPMEDPSLGLEAPRLHHHEVQVCGSHYQAGYVRHGAVVCGSHYLAGCVQHGAVVCGTHYQAGCVWHGGFAWWSGVYGHLHSS